MEACIKVEHLYKKIKNFRLENISFLLESGYVLGLIGRNGAGKTTLINTILGLWTPDQGSVEIAGLDRVKDEIRAKNEIAFVTDECLFPLEMTPYSIGKIFGKVYDAFDYEHYKKLCERFRLPMHKRLQRMSKGMVIRLQLAFAFSRRVKLYIFDEPSAGLDPVFRKELVDLIFDLTYDGDKSVIFSTHLTDELDRIADYILFLEEGKQKLFEQKEELVSRYKLIRGSEEQIEEFAEKIIGKKTTPNSCEALIKMENQNKQSDIINYNIESNDIFASGSRPLITTPTIEDIMYYFIKGV
ncbi:MAG: ABC transporter ATP-binding protein [Clostridiales bacterium]|jgi:ABC-2 type transport system ATP-binding protein|nr:ABC transporter ATP-binding protein [Clostridiales bacterium]